MNKEKIEKYLERFKNTGTIMALVGAVGLLAQQCGAKVDLEWINNVATTVCTILVLLGICNNPTTSGIDVPGKVNK